jgi:hypothetical protein
MPPMEGPSGPLWEQAQLFDSCKSSLMIYLNRSSLIELLEILLAGSTSMRKIGVLKLSCPCVLSKYPRKVVALTSDGTPIGGYESAITPTTETTDTRQRGNTIWLQSRVGEWLAATPHSIDK